MLRARTVIPCSLLMAGCALTVVANLPATAQVPQNPGNRAGERQTAIKPADEPRNPDQQTFELPKSIDAKIKTLIKAKPAVAVSVDDALRKLLVARYEAAVKALEVRRRALRRRSDNDRSAPFRHPFDPRCPARIER